MKYANLSQIDKNQIKEEPATVVIELLILTRLLYAGNMVSLLKKMQGH